MKLSPPHSRVSLLITTMLALCGCVLNVSAQDDIDGLAALKTKRHRQIDACSNDLYALGLSSRLGPPSRERLWSCVPAHAKQRGSDYHYMVAPERTELAEGLLAAVQAKDIHCVADTLDGGAHINDTSASGSVPGGPALHLALAAGDWPMAVYLLSRGARPELTNAGNKTALQVLSRYAPDCIFLRLASRYFDLGIWADAATAFTHIAEHERRNAGAAYNVAVSLDRQGRNDQAIRWYTETLARDPHFQNREKAIAARILQLRK
jgi:tetratricopeptide (TPR) repeat protein